MKNDREKSFHLFMKSFLFLPYVAKPLLHKPYKYVPPQTVWVLRHFGLKRGIHFAHFGLESGIAFQWGNYGSVWTYLSFQIQVHKKEKVIYEL